MARRSREDKDPTPNSVDGKPASRETRFYEPQILVVPNPATLGKPLPKSSVWESPTNMKQPSGTSRRKRERLLNKQRKVVNTRLKYGPLMKPGLVTVKDQSGMVLAVVSQWKFGAPR